MSDTIAALSTGNCVSAIGILRLSGDDCAAIAGAVFTPSNGKTLCDAPDRKLILGTLHDAQHRVIDHCCAIYCRAPHSYTGENTIEIQCHGSPAVLAAGLEALYQAGARPARRGEFTKRAFLSGKLGLTQAEAVIDLIEADTADAAANAAGQVGGVLQRKLQPIYDELTDLCSHFHAVLDYPDEDIEDFGLVNYALPLQKDVQLLQQLLQSYSQGRILRDGVRAAIIGRPNVGKSSLLNALAGYERVIVTEVAGTTRDTVEESVRVGSTRLRLIDTAGIRDSEDVVEALGIARSKQAMQNAELVIFVCDASVPLSDDDLAIIDLCAEHENAIAVLNKCDIGCAVEPSELPFLYVVKTCAKSGEGLELLAQAVDMIFEGGAPCDGSLLTNARQVDAIRRAKDAVERALDALHAHMTPDAVLTDIEQAMQAMGEVTGGTVREDITARIFERFCVGK